MLTADFDFDLPEHLIARYPLPQRGQSRLLVVDRQKGSIQHTQFAELKSYLRAGDCLVFNDSRVVPARFFSPDQRREILRTRIVEPFLWQCLVKPGKQFRIGHTFQIGSATGTIETILENGERLIRFDQAVDEKAHGHLALPPYMSREEELLDRDRYQTVFAKHDGSIAAPTAGLHFSPELMGRLPAAFITLHVGVGTFKPVQVDEIEAHDMHFEHYQLGAEAAHLINSAQRRIAVGTTSARVLEHIAGQMPVGSDQKVIEQSGSTNIFIYPGHTFRCVDALITNFHLPKSTLLMLVSALAGRELILEAYREAIEREYRFYSYGDAMLIM